MKNKLLMVCVLFVFCFGMSGFGSAEDGSVQLDDVVVKATRIEMSLDNISTNVIVIPREKLEKYEARDVSDLLRQIPGFTIFNLNGGPRSDMYVSSRGNQPSTRGAKIMVNGIEFNNGSGYFNVLKIPINDIEQIEIIKNPSSSLYGNLGTGGVINVVTRKASNPLEAKAGISLQTYDGKKAFAVLNGAENNWEYHLEGSYFRTDGYRDNAWEKNGQIYGKLAYHLNQTSFLEFQGVHSPSENGYPGTISQAQFEEDPRQTNQPYGIGDSANTLVSMAYNKDFTGSKLQAKVKYDTQDGYALEDWGHFDFDSYIVIPEINYTVYANLAGMDHTLLMGAEYRYYNSDSISHEVDPATGEKLAVSTDRFQEDKDWGLFIQDEIIVNDLLTLTMGVRYDYFETDLEDHLNTADSFTSSDSALSPNIGAAYHLSQGATVFGNYTRAFKKPTTTAFIKNLDLDPEKIDSFELGMRGSPLAFLSYNIALFHVDTRDKVVRTGSVFTYENAGKLRSQGVEIGINMDFGNGFTGAVNYTRQNSEWREWYSSGVSYEGKLLTRVPRDILGVSAGYSHPVAGSFFIYGNYTGERYMDNANTLKLDDHFIVNMKYTKLFTSFECDMEFFVSVENLTDENYAEVGWNGWLSPMPERSFTAGLTFAF